VPAIKRRGERREVTLAERGDELGLGAASLGRDGRSRRWRPTFHGNLYRKPIVLAANQSSS